MVVKDWWSSLFILSKNFFSYYLYLLQDVGEKNVIILIVLFSSSHYCYCNGYTDPLVHLHIITNFTCLLNRVIVRTNHRSNEQTVLEKTENRCLLLFLFLSISLLLCTLILYISWKQFSSFIIDIPDYLNQLSALWIQMQSKLSNYTYHLPVELVSQIQFMIAKALASIEKFSLSLTNVNVWSTLLTYIPTRLFDIFVYWIVLYMLLLELPTINRKLLSPVPFHYHQKLSLLANVLS